MKNEGPEIQISGRVSGTGPWYAMPESTPNQLKASKIKIAQSASLLLTKQLSIVANKVMRSKAHSEANPQISMTCEACDLKCQRFGTHRNGLRRFRCLSCKKTYTEPHQTLGEMYVSEEKVLLAMQVLIEGNSIRSTMRITGLDQNTIIKALILAGERCEKVMGRLIVNVPAKDVECDEIWGYVQKKEAHKFPFEADDKNIGDAYCFVAIERHSKLVLNFALGRRDTATTQIFIEGLRHATSGKQPF